MRTFEERIQQLIDVHGDRELYDFAVHVYHSGFADGLKPEIRSADGVRGCVDAAMSDADVNPLRAGDPVVWVAAKYPRVAWSTMSEFYSGNVVHAGNKSPEGYVLNDPKDGQVTIHLALPDGVRTDPPSTIGWPYRPCP